MKTVNKHILIAWIIAILLALIFILTVAAKITGTQVQTSYLIAMGLPKWLNFPLGLFELILALGLLLPGFRLWSAVITLVWALTEVVLFMRADPVQVQAALLAAGVIVLDVLLLRSVYMKAKAIPEQAASNDSRHE